MLQIPLGQPPRGVHEVRGRGQANRLDVRTVPLEVRSDDPGLVRALPAGRDGCVVAGQDFFGEQGETGGIQRFEALVGDEPAPGQGEDRDGAGLARGGDEARDALKVHTGTRRADALDAGDEVPEAGARLELECAREPVSHPYQSLEVFLAALAAQQVHETTDHLYPVLLLAHALAGGAATHLTVEADAIFGISGAAPQGEDSA